MLRTQEFVTAPSSTLPFHNPSLFEAKTDYDCVIGETVFVLIGRPMR